MVIWFWPSSTGTWITAFLPSPLIERDAKSPTLRLLDRIEKSETSVPASSAPLISTATKPSGTPFWSSASFTSNSGGLRSSSRCSSLSTPGRISCTACLALFRMIARRTISGLHRYFLSWPARMKRPSLSRPWLTCQPISLSPSSDE